MPTTAELRALPSIQTAYLLVIDGCPTIWSTSDDVTGTTYISGRTIRSGLRLPSYAYGIDVSLGTLEQDETSFEIEDIAGDLVSLFATEVESVSTLPTTITPLTDLSAESDLFGKHIGTEAIGPAGERHQHYAVLGYQIGGEHIGEDAGRTDMPAAPVSDTPVVWAGRRVVLYQIYRDHVTYPDRDAGVSSWRTAAEAERIWWGTIRDAGQAEHRRWTIRCDGPSSWLRKPLGLLSQAQPTVVADAEVQFVHEIGQSEMYYGLLTRTQVIFGALSSFGESAMTETFSAGDYTTMTTELAATMSTAIAATGPDGEFTDEGFATASLDVGSAQVQIRVEAVDLDLFPNTYRRAAVMVIMHAKAWRVLGYAPELQGHSSRFNSAGFPVGSKSVRFSPVATFNFPTAGLVSMPAEGYWLGVFTTDAIQGEDYTASSNDGNTRIYEPWYTTGGSSGTITLQAEPVSGGQLVTLPLEDIYHRGQLDRPVASDPDDDDDPFAIAGIGDCDAQGLWVFFGPRADETAPDKVYDYVQVARCSWVRAGGGAYTSIEGAPEPKLVIREWLDPRAYGFPFDRMATDWVGTRYGDPEDRIQCRPLHTLAYSPEPTDDVTTVLQRLLLTSGTATGWYQTTGYATPAYGEGTAYLEAGQNDPGFAGVARDAEFADFGLGIPSSMVATEDSWDAIQSSIEADGVELGKVRVSFLAGASAEEIINGLIDPLGLSISLRGGRYGLLALSDDFTPANVDATLAETDLLWEGDRMPRQEIRAYQPIDKVQFQLDQDPVSLEYAHTIEFTSRDRGARYRPGGIVREVLAPSIRSARPILPGGMLSRWARITRFWERRHFWIRGYPVLRTAALDLWPGSIVSVTDQRLVSQAGAYGVTSFLGIVTRVSVDTDGPPIKKLDILVHAASALGRSYHAPMAKGIGWDPATNRIYCADDVLGLNDGTLDVSDFVEPAWSSAGGDADVKWFQWDGYEWTETGSGTVASVSAVAGACYLQLDGAPSGTYYRSRDTIVVMREHTNQSAAWVLALYAPVCDDAGEYDGTPGIRFLDA